jgi:tRNA 2-thiocytidine biosynthesis protein TtcA
MAIIIGVWRLAVKRLFLYNKQRPAEEGDLMVEQDPARKLSYWLLKKVNKAVRDYNLIEDGDRIAVAVSGGKDSLSLLRLLQVRQESAQEHYELIAVHVQSDYIPGGEAQRARLESWLADNLLPYAIESISIRPGPGDRQPNCFWCSWNRRKAIFLTAHRLGANKVAFGHHADDIAQTALLNLFYHGRLETMEPRVEFFGGLITVIRPLAYVPEKELARFAQASDFPQEPYCCPTGLDSRRAKIAQLLRVIESDCPGVKDNLARAVSRCRLKPEGHSP